MSISPRLRGVVRLAAGVLTVVLIAFLIRAVSRDGPAAVAAWHAAHVRWSWIVLATACGLGGHAVYVLGWRRLLIDIGIRASFWRLARLFLVSNLGRYLPGGKAWQMALVGMMAAEQQLPPAAVAASSLLQGVVGVAVGAVVFVATGGALIGLSAAWLVLPFAGVVGLLLTPAIVRALPHLRAVIGRWVPDVDSLTAATMWALVWTAATSWFAWGVALYALASGLLPSPVSSLSAYTAAWAGSFLAGVLAVVSPAGLGAREGVMQAVLVQAGVTSGDVLVLVAVARAWVTVLDIVPAAIVLVLRRRSHRTADVSSQPATIDGAS